MNKPVIEISGTNREHIAGLRKAIIDILSIEKCGDSPKVEAMKTLSELCKVETVNIANCIFDRDPRTTVKKKATKRKPRK